MDASSLRRLPTGLAARALIRRRPAGSAGAAFAPSGASRAVSFLCLVLGSAPARLWAGPHLHPAEAIHIEGSAVYAAGRLSPEDARRERASSLQVPTACPLSRDTERGTPALPPAKPTRGMRWHLLQSPRNALSLSPSPSSPHTQSLLPLSFYCSVPFLFALLTLQIFTLPALWLPMC